MDPVPQWRRWEEMVMVVVVLVVDRCSFPISRAVALLQPD